MSTAWESRYAKRASRMEGSAIREILKLTEQPEVISFAGGLPAPEANTNPFGYKFSWSPRGVMLAAQTALR